MKLIIIFLLFGILLFPNLVNADTETTTPGSEDHAPPLRENSQPTGTLAAGTTQTTISLDTDELAFCKYSTLRWVHYDLMPNSFSIADILTAALGGKSHFALVTGLSSGNTYKYYVKCSDPKSNVTSDDFLISFSVADDTTPPVLSDGQPAGTLDIGTTQTNLGLTTNEPATCRYSATSTTYDLMPNTFSATGGILHSTPVTGLSNGNTYTYYIKCSDNSGNANTDDLTISFSVPPSPTLFVTLTASASSGRAPLNGVDFTADVSGTATGTINYTFYCDRPDSGTNITPNYDTKYNSIVAVSKKAEDVCSYSSPDTYYSKVIVERGTKIAESRVEIIVTEEEAPEEEVVEEVKEEIVREPSLLEIIQTKIAEIQQKINELIKQLNELLQQQTATIWTAFQRFLQSFFGK